MNRTSPSSREGQHLWLLKAASGILIVVILIIHLIVNHLAAPGGLLTYADVLAYYQIALVPWMEAVFVILAVTHSLVGLRGIMLDLHPSRAVSRLADIFFVLVGSVAVTYGLWLIATLVQRGG